jgi:hypothetical protein
MIKKAGFVVRVLNNSKYRLVDLVCLSGKQQNQKPECFAFFKI